MISSYFDQDKWLGSWFAPMNSPTGSTAKGLPATVSALWASPDRLQIFVGNLERMAVSAYWEAQSRWTSWSVL